MKKHIIITLLSFAATGVLLFSGCSNEPVVVNNYYTTNNDGAVQSTVSESIASGSSSASSVPSSESSTASKTDSKPKTDQPIDTNLVVGINYTVTGTTNYLAVRNAPAYDGNNEIAKMKNGDELTIQSQNVYGDKGEYCYITALTGAAKGQSGYVNKNYITPSVSKTNTTTQQTNSAKTESQKTENKSAGNTVSQTDTASSEPEQSPDYVSMLREYAESGAWKNDCDPNTEIGSPASCNDLSYSIFDLDSNGIPEMLIYATAPEMSGPRVMSASSFCVISDGQVKTIESGSTSGGTIGGSTVGLCEEKTTGRLMIYKNTYTGGFGGNASGYSVYSFYNSVLTQELNVSQITYMDTSLGSDEYTINGQSSTMEETSAKIGKYDYVSSQNISSKITTY